MNLSAPVNLVIVGLVPTTQTRLANIEKNWGLGTNPSMTKFGSKADNHLIIRTDTRMRGHTHIKISLCHVAQFERVWYERAK